MTHVRFDPSDLEGKAGYFLLTSLVIPRPIAWVSTVSEDGILNLAPHSFFNVISGNPPILHFTSTGVKDTLTNIRASGEFVVSLVNEALAEQMNDTAADFPPDESEFTWAGLETAPSAVVAPPRVALSPAAFECKVNEIVSKGNGNMVFGDIVTMHIDEAVMEDGRVMPDLLKPLARLGGSYYSTIAGHTFKMPRPTWEEMQEHGPRR